MEIKTQQITVQNPGALSDLFYDVLGAENEVDQDKEHFWVVGLNTRMIIQYIELVSLGSLNYTLVHPREVFRLAVMKATCSLVLVHNHPSGHTEPSNDDISLTRRLVEAGRVLGIEVLDHVIVGRADNKMSGFYSFKHFDVL